MKDSQTSFLKALDSSVPTGALPEKDPSRRLTGTSSYSRYVRPLGPFKLKCTERAADETLWRLMPTSAATTDASRATTTSKISEHNSGLLRPLRSSETPWRRRSFYVCKRYTEPGSPKTDFLEGSSSRVSSAYERAGIFQLVDPVD